MHRVLIVDHHPLIGSGIGHILETNGYQVIAKETSGQNAIKSALRLQPDLMIMDLHLPDYHGLEVIRVIRDISTAVRIIVLTAYNDCHYQLRCKGLGVEGYMLKTELTETLMVVVEAVMSGAQRYPPVTGSLPDIDNGRRLTSREKTILNCLASGMNNREIAEKLAISDKTVSAHKRKMMKKLGAKNIVDLLSKSSAIINSQIP